ncbi:MAG: hypothetical protein JNL66_09805 [Alphaproteobacteria bacterium]|nr:hypothetical protein [Alphaproteobacteria bacterium]
MKLPVGRILGAAYYHVVGEARAFIVDALPWIVAIFVARIAASAALILSALDAESARDARALILLPLMIALLTAAIGVSFAVMWSRRTLVGERPVGLLPAAPGPRELRCVGVLLAMALIVIVPVGLLGGVALVLAFSGGTIRGIQTIYAIAIIIATWLIAKLSLAVPLVAVDDPRGAIATSWHLTSGRMVAMIGIVVGTVIPPWIVSYLIGVALGWVGDPTEWPLVLLVAAAESVVAIAGLAVWHGATALALWAVLETDEGAAPAPP